MCKVKCFRDSWLCNPVIVCSVGISFLTPWRPIHVRTWNGISCRLLPWKHAVEYLLYITSLYPTSLGLTPAFSLSQGSPAATMEQRQGQPWKSSATLPCPCWSGLLVLPLDPGTFPCSMLCESPFGWLHLRNDNVIAGNDNSTHKDKQLFGYLF